MRTTQQRSHVFLVSTSPRANWASRRSRKPSTWGRAQATKDLVADPDAGAGPLRLERGDGLLVVQVGARIEEAGVPAAGGVELYVVIGQERAAAAGEHPAPALALR
jgi:hypothetical protein